MASAVGEPPSILDRVDRLDVLLGYLERREIRAAARSPGASTTSSGTLTTSDGGNSSVSSSPKCLTRRRCRSIHDVVMEVQVKGNLMDRVDYLENRLLKLVEHSQLEEEIEKERKTEDEGRSPRSGEKRKHGKGLRRLVRSCVKGKLETKD